MVNKNQLSMEIVNRKVTYRLYPSQSQANRMLEMLRLHQRLYNACLEQRIDAYRRCGVSLNYHDQAKELTALRAEDEAYKNLNAQSSQVTLKRLELAYKRFFDRVKKGQKAGFPRFKAIDRYKGWGYATHGDGWRFTAGKGFINGTLRLSGVGHLQARGRARKDPWKKEEQRDPGTPKTMETIHKNGKWYASVTFKRQKPGRDSSTDVVGIDWGTMKFLTIVDSFGNIREKANPRLMKKFESKLKEKQRILSKKKKGSQNRKKAKHALCVIHEKLANKREDHLHQESADVVKQAQLIATEKLNVKGMTAKGGSRKKGLNRSILDTSPSTFFAMLKYKAEEAGIKYEEIPTRKVKPSQTCVNCGNKEKKKLEERVHSCQKCGFTCDRDVNAGSVMICYALSGKPSLREVKDTGQELALGMESWVTGMLKCETPPISEHIH